MKKTAFLFIVFACNIIFYKNATSQIIKTNVSSTPYGGTDSVIVFKEYTIDTIIGNDTVFFVQFWHEGWRFDSTGILTKHCLEKEYTYGLVYKGLNNGRWKVSDFTLNCFYEKSFTSTSRVYYRGNDLNTFFSNPGNDKYFFLKDTLKFSKCPNDRNYIDFFYPDTINVIVTKDSFSVKINDIPFLKEETKFINEVSADIEQGLYSRKYRMLRDSVKIQR